MHASCLLRGSASSALAAVPAAPVPAWTTFPMHSTISSLKHFSFWQVAKAV